MQSEARRTGQMLRTYARMAMACLAALLVLGTVTLSVSAKDKEPSSEKVDSGALGIFINGKRVATETFTIQQSPSGSVTTSEFKTEEGLDRADQTSELQLSGSGELKKYEWKELSPGQSQASVLPSENFLTERYSSNPQEKPREQPFLLPASTSILDDYFFIQREVLAWKYLATACRPDKGQIQCPLKQKTQFGTLNPHARSSMLVTLEFAGVEKLSIHGVERDYTRLDLKSEAGDWSLWLDEQHKLVRILVESDKTEVIRD